MKTASLQAVDQFGSSLSWFFHHCCLSASVDTPSTSLSDYKKHLLVLKLNFVSGCITRVGPINASKIGLYNAIALLSNARTSL